MNKSELVKALADQPTFLWMRRPLWSTRLWTGMKDSLLEGGRVEIRGFGSFKVKEYGSYAGAIRAPVKRLPWNPSAFPSSAPGKNSKNISTRKFEMREFVSVNTDGVKTSRRCPGESASPGFLVLCLLLFSFIGTAVASELFPEGEGLRTALSFSFPPRRSRSCASCMPPIPTARFIPALPEDTRW